MSVEGPARDSLEESDMSDSEIKRIALWKLSSSAENFISPIDRRADYYRQLARASGHELPPAQPLLTIPNTLTLFRIALVPLLVVLFFSPDPSAPVLAAITFSLAATTDWADGYLARRLRITSAFGAFLDPVADKLMVTTALILLAAQPPPGLSQETMAVPVLIAISREITMSSLREWAAKSSSQASKAVKVNALGKWKTALQMVAIIALYTWRDQKHFFGPTMSREAAVALQHGPAVSLGLLWLSTFFALLSLWNYMSNVWLFFRYPEGVKPRKIR